MKYLLILFDFRVFPLSSKFFLLTLAFIASTKDPIIQHLFDIMTEHWQPRSKTGSQTSLEGEHETTPDETDEHTGPDECLDDAYGTQELAAGLGVNTENLAEPVAALSDSQCVETQVLADTMIDSPEDPDLRKDPQWTDAQPRYPMVETSKEDSPKGDEVETPGSVSPQVPFEALAPPQQYTQKDLDLLKARMEAIKSLSPFGNLNSFYLVHFLLGFL